MLRDIQWLRYVGVNNGASVYWKTSKPMADGVSAHLKDSIIASIYGGNAHMMGPAGPFTMQMDNVTFVRWEDPKWQGPCILIGQHCGLAHHRGGVEGQGCSVQYFLKNMDWSFVPPSVRRIQFGVSGGNQLVPMITTGDDSLDGYQSLISPLLNGFAGVSGCEVTSERWSFATGCTHRARRLILWPKPGPLYPDGVGPDDLPQYTGIHTVLGKEYALSCGDGTYACELWNRAAFDRYWEQSPVSGEWTGTDNDPGTINLFKFGYVRIQIQGPGYDEVEPIFGHRSEDWPAGMCTPSSLENETKRPPQLTYPHATTTVTHPPVPSHPIQAHPSPHTHHHTPPQTPHPHHPPTSSTSPYHHPIPSLS